MALATLRALGRRPLARHAALVALVAACHAPLHAQIYASAEDPGAPVVLSNFRSDDTPRVLIALPPAGVVVPSVSASPSALLRGTPATTLQLPAAPIEVQRVINEVAALVKISPELLHAVIATESRYDSRAVSSRGAIGLMQLLPATAKRFGAIDPYATRDNVLAGATYLKWLMAMFPDDLELVLAAYNAGEQAVLKAGRRIPPFAETQAYVPRVLAYLRCANSPTCRPV